MSSSTNEATAVPYEETKVSGCLNRRFQPDLLIGAHYFMQFEIEEREQLASGPHLATSEVGCMVVGESIG